MKEGTLNSRRFTPRAGAHDGGAKARDNLSAAANATAAETRTQGASQMHVCRKPILATIAATALLAIAASAAPARNLSVNKTGFELIWSEFGIRTKLRFIAAGRTIECKVTLLGQFEEHTIAKGTALNQGSINHGELSECTGGTATVRTETMPWILRYRSFTGTLPTIRSATLGVIRASFRIRESGGLTCEATSEVNHPAVLILGNSSEVIENGFEGSGEPDVVTVERGNRIPLGGEFPCVFAGEGTIGGIGDILEQLRILHLRITLI